MKCEVSPNVFWGTLCWAHSCWRQPRRNSTIACCCRLVAAAGFAVAEHSALVVLGAVLLAVPDLAAPTQCAAVRQNGVAARGLTDAEGAAGVAG
jgi:hypothetical protein